MKKKKYSRSDAEADIMNSPFSETLGWKKKKGLTKAGRSVAGRFGKSQT